MPDSTTPLMLNRAGFDIFLAGQPEVFRSLDKYAPKQNDFAKTIISSALQLENSFGQPRSIVIGGPLDPSQLNRIGGFFSDETSLLAYVLTKSQLVRFLEVHGDLPAVFVLSSRENPYALDAFRMLALSLGRHSEKYGAKLLTGTYEECKKLERTELKSSSHSLVLEEKFGKSIVLKTDEATVKDRVRFFSRGGLDWDKARDDRAYFEPGWALGSFFLKDSKDQLQKQGVRIRIETVQISDGSQGPSILGLKSAIESLHGWVESLRAERKIPELSSIHYSIPSVPVTGWIGDRFDRIYGRKLRHYAPSLLWGWHPAADFVEFLRHDGGGTALLIDTEDFPRITATIRYGVGYEH